MSYSVDIPDAPNNPSDDQPLMKANTNAVFNFVAVDHIPFNELNSGYHTVIHQKPFEGNSWDPVAGTGGPANVAATEQTFSLFYTPDCNDPTTDTQLFALSNTSTPYQLTGASTKAEGYGWTGGLLISWGSVTFVTVDPFKNKQTGSVTFKTRDDKAIPFPNRCRAVTATLTFKSTSTRLATLSVANISTTGFDWYFNSDGNGVKGIDVYDGFYWTAIGF